MFRLQAQPNPDFARLRVFDDVVDGFLEREKNIVAHFRRNRRRRQLRRHVHAITQSGEREIFLRVFAGVIRQTFERVVGRIDGPDDFIERMRRLARGFGNLLRVRFNFVGQIFVSFGHFAEQRDLRQIRAELVVQIACDARTLFFQRFLLLEQLQLGVAIFAWKYNAQWRRQFRPDIKSPQPRNHHVCQNCGCTVISSAAPVSFQSPSSLQAMT